MTSSLKFYLVQDNPTVGALKENRHLAEAHYHKAVEAGADLVIFSELFACGYPPDDLLLSSSFVLDVKASVEELAKLTKNQDTAILMGTPWPQGGRAFNAAALLENGEVTQLAFKHELPNYGVFDEERVFEFDPNPLPLRFREHRLGVMICEDIWFPYVTQLHAKHGAEILIAINGSPFDQHKQHVREEMARLRVAESGLPMVYVNQVGGQDELVFDGKSFVMDKTGQKILQLPAWETHTHLFSFQRRLESIEYDKLDPGLRRDESKEDQELYDIYNALCVGVRDYVRKNGFEKVLLGLSGGIDSALVATIATDALGPENVLVVGLPSQYTSEESVQDATQLAENLGVELQMLPIGDGVEATSQTLTTFLGTAPTGLTAENLQSRLRGLYLMALSNQTGALLLTTGNKSELAVGYATLYGDMCGAFNVIKDLYKTKVYELSRWRNQQGEESVIPDNILTKAPTAELRPDQKDEDSLPPYETLDAVLEGLIESGLGVEDIVAKGFDKPLVADIMRLLTRAEYKRTQAAPGVKITEKAFGRDRRYPLTNGYLPE